MWWSLYCKLLEQVVVALASVHTATRFLRATGVNSSFNMMSYLNRKHNFLIFTHVNEGLKLHPKNAIFTDQAVMMAFFLIESN